MAHRVTLIPGDGTGPELVTATRRVLEATGVPFDWDVHDAGADVMDKYGTPLPDNVLDSIRANKVALKGPITTPVGTSIRVADSDDDCRSGRRHATICVFVLPASLAHGDRVAGSVGDVAEFGPPVLDETAPFVPLVVTGVLVHATGP